MPRISAAKTAMRKRRFGNQKLTLLPQLGLALLDGAKSHVADGGSRNLVQAGTTAKNGDDVQVLSAGVISAVHHGADGKRERGAELGAGGDTTALLLLAGCCRGHLGEDAVTSQAPAVPSDKNCNAPCSVAISSRLCTATSASAARSDRLRTKWSRRRRRRRRRVQRLISCLSHGE